MIRSAAVVLAAALAAVAAGFAAAPGDSITLDFAKEKLPDGWSVAAKSFKVEEGELRFAGDGLVDFAGPIAPDFRMTFKGSSAEKASFELKVFDVATGAELYTFAFGGRWHSVLDGVKSSILRADRFVAVDSKMWIFPGRKFTFEMRSAKGQLQMYLDGVLGPFFVDSQPVATPKGVKLKIIESTEGSKDRVTLDDIVLEYSKP
jgi:hypothetical protein